MHFGKNVVCLPPVLILGVHQHSCRHFCAARVLSLRCRERVHLGRFAATLPRRLREAVLEHCTKVAFHSRPATAPTWLGGVLLTAASFYATSAVLSFPPLVTHMVSVPGAQGTNEGEHWQVLLAQPSAICLRSLSTPEGTVWTKALVFPPTRGSCTAAAAPLVLGGGGSRTRSSSK